MRFSPVVWMSALRLLMACVLCILTLRLFSASSDASRNPPIIVSHVTPVRVCPCGSKNTSQYLTFIPAARSK